MSPAHSKTLHLYDEIRKDLQAGRYLPGERLDPATLAREHFTSPTPVRNALYHLVGEGVISEPTREGFHAPYVTESSLHQLYDWIDRLLTTACDVGFPYTLDEALRGVGAQGVIVTERVEDILMLTHHLFDVIASATGHPYLYRAIRTASTQLAPIRKAELRLIPNGCDELAQLYQHWQTGDSTLLRMALVAYHDHRKKLVTRILGILARINPHMRA